MLTAIKTCDSCGGVLYAGGAFTAAEDCDPCWAAARERELAELVAELDAHMRRRFSLHGDAEPAPKGGVPC